MNRETLPLHDAKKYLNYFFETRGFTTDARGRTAQRLGAASPAALDAARDARGTSHGPALFIHGIMPRSGTVYVGELLRRHPQLHAYPHHLWELPALQLTGDVLKLQQKFLLGYWLNNDKLADADFLPLFGAALLALLHQPVPPDQRVLVKMPNVQYLSHFFTMFPHEQLLILLRDGRDLVHSTLRTWPRLNFIQVCLRWRRSAIGVRRALDHFAETGRAGHWLVRYEDVLQDPHAFVRQACRRFCLDPQSYPYGEIDNIRVIGSSTLAQGREEVKWDHLQKPRDFRPTGYWRNWSTLRKTIFKTIAGRALLDLGYSKNNDW